MKKFLSILLSLGMFLTCAYATDEQSEQEHWAMQSVNGLVENEYITYDSNDLDGYITYSEIIDITYEVLGFEQTEATITEKYDEMIANGVELNEVLTQEYDHIVIREECANFVLEIMKYYDLDTSIVAGINWEILDFDLVSEENAEAVLVLWSQGISNGYLGEFSPEKKITLSEYYVLIARALEITEKTEKIGDLLPIVAYHSVNDDEQHIGNNYVVTTEIFRSDLEYIRDNGFNTVLVEDLINYAYYGIELPENPIMITFDDGYLDNYENAFKILQEFEMKAVICPVTKNYVEDVETIFGHLTLEQTVEMVDSGLIEIQNHSYDMHDTSRRLGVLRNNDEDIEEYTQALIEDLQKSADFYEESELPVQTTFSYPFGQYNEETEEIIKEYGYLASFGTNPAKLNQITDSESIYMLSRCTRIPTLTTEQYFFKLLTLEIR